MTQTQGERRVEYMPLDQIARAPRNPKGHDSDGIRESISAFGLADLPVLDDRTGRLVSGHGRLDDLTARHDAGETPPDGITTSDDGTWLVPVIRGWSSRSDQEAEAYLLYANQSTVKGGWDQHGLAELLGDLADHDARLLDLAGWTADDLDDMRRLLAPPDLDDLARDVGDPDPADLWPVIHVKVPKHVAAAWRSHVDTHNGDEAAALAALLDVDVEAPPPSDWAP